MDGYDGCRRRCLRAGVLSPLLRPWSATNRLVAAATVLAYRWIRRLLPFIICHFVWDAGITIGGYSHTAGALFDGLFFVAALIFLLMWAAETFFRKGDEMIPRC